VGIAAVAVAILLLVLLKDDGDGSGAETTAIRQATSPPPGSQPNETTPAEPAVPTIVVDKAGMPVGGVAEISVDAGDEIRFKVKSAVADEVHVHGYDVEREVAAGRATEFAFPADIEGLFEVELHDSEEQIAELRVNP